MGTAVVRLVDDPRAAAWLTRRIGPGHGGAPRVGDLLPGGFAAYLRVLHPAIADDAALTWAEVARRSGVGLHALTGWSQLAGAGVGEPAVGTLPVEQLAALCDVLAGHTTAAEECTFALWTGWPGWSAPGASELLLGSAPPAGDDAPAGPAYDPPRVTFAGHDHVLVAGPLTAAVPLSFSDAPGRWWAQSPTAFWPADRAWCVTTAPERRCTLVAGTVALAEDLLAASELEAWPVRPEDPMPS